MAVADITILHWGSVVVPIVVLVMAHFFGHQSQAIRSLVALTHLWLLAFIIGAWLSPPRFPSETQVIHLSLLHAMGITLSVANLRPGFGVHQTLGWIGLVAWGLNANAVILMAALGQMSDKSEGLHVGVGLLVVLLVGNPLALSCAMRASQAA